MLGLSVHRSAIVGRVLPVLSAVALLLSACAPQRAGQSESKPAAPAAGAPAGKPGEAAQPAAAPGATTVKFSHVVAKDTPKGKAADRFAELVNQKSGGKIQVQVFANSELYKDAEELEALQTNAIQFIAPGTDKFGGLAPQWDATALPYIFTSDAAVNKLLDPDNPVAKELFESMRPKGLIGLASRRASQPPGPPPGSPARPPSRPLPRAR